MGISFLRPLLQSLCCNSSWNYAVFWKLTHQDEMVLMWEDGFCDLLKLRYPMVSPIEDLHLENSNKIMSSTFSPSVVHGTRGECPVGLAVAEMSSGLHVVGQGIVGKAALTDNASWIHSDSIATDVFNSVLVPEYPDEWLLQFAAGIKTVLLLPVIPHGVLQLGSVEMVAEDAALVAYVKDEFVAHIKSDKYDLEYSAQHFSMMSAFLQNLDEPWTTTPENVIEGQTAIHAVRTIDCNLTDNQMLPAFAVQDFRNSSPRFAADTLESLTEIDFCQQPLSMIGLAESCQLSYEDHKFYSTNNDISQYYPEETLSPSYCDNFNRRMCGEFMNDSMDFHFYEGAFEATFVGDDFDSTFCEWDKILGTAVEDNPYPYTYGFPMNDLDAEHLLVPVVANASSSDNYSSKKSTITSSGGSLGESFASSEKCDKSKDTVSVEVYEAPSNFMASEIIAPRTNAARNVSASVSSVENKIIAFSDKQLKRKGYDSVNPGKISTTNKKRARNGDNQRTKPRDRQLIQDRLKELRELVPNSEKSSIDGLLDKTIKHMLFLRSVTKQADKLRHEVLEEESEEKTRKPAEANHSHQNGTSWAVELGSEKQLCPIVVKDLNHPKHLLIEMLCSDHYRFLEIADVIHRLQLTILKGVMGKSSDNSWARFIVETSGSFHRLDIFWPLMQLLQQNRAPISSKF